MPEPPAAEHPPPVAVGVEVLGKGAPGVGLGVRVLGEVEVLLDGAVLRLGGPRQVALLALLVAAGGRSVPAERLVDQLWGEAPPDNASGALQVGVAKLRRLLEPARQARGEATLLVTRAGGYALDLPPGAVDATRFAALVDEARQTGDPVAAEALLVESLGLWRGEAYGGVAALAPVLATEARRLHGLRWSAVERLWEVRLAGGGHVAAVPELRALVEEEPQREELWRLLTLALYRSGRQAEALEALREVRERLAEELGIDPGEPLRRLEQDVLRQEPSLAAPAVPHPAGRDPEAATDVVLPGREHLLAQTQRLVDAAAGGSGGVLLVSGDAGIGKTRLCRAVAEQAAAHGLDVGWGTWEQEDGPPLAGWRQAFAQLPAGQRVLDSGADDHDSVSTVFRLADEVVDALRRHPSCVVLDDVHWADPDSHRLLRRVVTTLGPVPSLLVVASRDVSTERDPEAAQTLGAVARGDTERVHLEGLDRDGVAAQVQEALGLEVEPSVADALRDRTDGNPFYVREMVRALAPTGVLEGERIDDWGGVPAGVRDVVRHRLAGLPPAVGRVLTAASVLGRSFDADVLEGTWDGTPEELDDALGLAEGVGLVEPADQPGSYRFVHALARDAVYEELATRARARAHARAGAALEQARIGRLDRHAVALAEHYRLAGPVHARDAWIYTERGAAHGAEQGLHADAARLLGSAVELQQDDPYLEPTERERVLTALGQALHRSARTIEAWPPLAAAARSALDRGDAVSAAGSLLAITEKVAWTWRQSPAWDADAIALWERVLATLPDGEVRLRSLCGAALAAEMLHQPGTADRSVRLAEEAMAEARRVGDPHLLGDVCALAQLALVRPDLKARGVALADEVISLRHRTADEAGLAAALTRRSDHRVELGLWEEGIADALRAREIARRLHLAPTVMVTELRLAVVAQAHGRWDEARASLDVAEQIHAISSISGHGMAGAVWALTRIVTGGLGELEPMLRGSLHHHPILRDIHALALLDLGRDPEARTSLGAWTDQDEISWDYMWLARTVLRAHVWSRLGDQQAMSDLRHQLTPYADRLAVAQFMLGSVRHALAELALAAGDPAESREHGEAALATHERLGWTPWVERTRALLDRIGSTAREPR